MESYGNSNELIQDLRQQRGTQVNQKFFPTSTPAAHYVLVGVFLLFQFFILYTVFESRQESVVTILQTERRIADRIDLSVAIQQNTPELIRRPRKIKSGDLVGF